MAQEAPKLRRTAETCPGSMRLWRPSCPSAEMPRSYPGFKEGRKPCADPSQEASEAPALSRPAPTGPHTQSHSARPSGQARLGPQWIVGAKGQRPRRPAAQPWRLNLAEAREARRESGTLRTTSPTRPCGKPKEGPAPQHKLNRTKALGKKNQ